MSAAEPGGGGSAASGTVGGGPVLELAIDPDIPTTLYAGTLCSGVLKSLDGGDSWSAVNAGLTNTDVHALAIDPATPATLYAGTEDGVFKSLNGGSDWQATGLTNQHVSALAIDPTTPATLYAGTDGGLFKSPDGGSTWSTLNPLWPFFPPDRANVTALAIDPTPPTTLYAGISLFPFALVFRSVDGGSIWQSPARLGQDRYVTALAINPATPATLYAGTEGGAFQSLNGGSDWQATGLTNQHVSALAIDPTTPATLYAGTERGGVFQSLNGSNSWSEVNTGLTTTIIYALAINPAPHATLYAGTIHGVFRSTNGAAGWQATGLGGVRCGDGFLCGGYEPCDDGGESATCDADCTLPQCGDGTLNLTAGEQCDDANRNPFDGCTNECTACGDGVVTSPEECEGGNTSSGDGCDAQCRRPHVVGDGTLESCTEAAFEAALAAGSVSFNCGPAPVTITLTSEKPITADTTIDGGGRITLSGVGALRIFTVDESAVLDVRNLTIADGHTEFSGGGINNAGTLTLTNCTLSGNSATIGGGGIVNQGTLTLTNCTLSGNSASIGGAILNGVPSGPPSGGAILNGVPFGSPVNLTLTNCTLSGNSASGIIARGGGGILSLGTLTLSNTIVANSPLGGDCSASGEINDGGRNLIEDPENSCGLTNGVNGNIVGVDPMLDPEGLKDNGGPTQTIALLPGSPATNAGDPDVCANSPVNGLDQRGYVRPGVGHAQCSIGAYEADAIPPACTGDCDGNGVVAINELILGVNIVFGEQPVGACPAFMNFDGMVDIAQLITGVNNALDGCRSGGPG